MVKLEEMKKFGYILAVLLVMAGCSNEEVVMDNSVAKGCLYASMEQGGGSSRMTMDGAYQLNWSNDDVISVFDSEGSSKSWSLTKTQGSKATFEGEALSAECVGAFLPATLGATLSENTLTVQLSELLEANVFYAPMWTNIQSLADVNEFKHLCAMLKINIKGVPQDYNQLIVEADKAIAGTFTANIPSDEPVLIPGSDTKKTVTASLQAGENVVCVPLPVQSYGTIKVYLTNGSESILLKDWSNKTVGRAHLYLTNIQHVSVATTAKEVNKVLATITKENPKTEVDFYEAFDAAQGSIELKTLYEQESESVLNFKVTPNTTSESPLYLKEDGVTKEETNKVVLTFPTEDSQLTKKSQLIYLDANTPNTTLTIKGGHFGELTARTASQTLVLDGNVIADEIIVLGGNVIVKKGCLVEKIINRSEGNITVTVEEGAEVKDFEGVFIIEKTTNSGENSDVTNGTWDPDNTTWD